MGVGALLLLLKRCIGATELGAPSLSARARPSLCRSCVFGRLRPCQDGKAHAKVRSQFTGQALHARRGCSSPPNLAARLAARLASQQGSLRQSAEGWAGRRGHQRSIGARSSSSSAMWRSSRQEPPRALKAPRQLHTGSQQRRQQQREAAKALRQQLTVGDSARKRRAHRGRQHVSE